MQQATVQITNAIKPALSIVKKTQAQTGTGSDPHKFWKDLKEEQKALIEEMFEKAFKVAEEMASRDPSGKKPEMLTCLYRVFAASESRLPKSLPILWQGIAAREFIRRYGV